MTYTFLKNGILEITAVGKELVVFADRTGILIWKAEVIDNDFRFVGVEE